ncbi:MAG: hypothetical protein JNL11_09665 [Bdellovibrionaceae bacterium]|nr:hypothetical protein [Pseudobdellovibrionaceae bacterium]
MKFIFKSIFYLLASILVSSCGSGSNDNSNSDKKNDINKVEELKTEDNSEYGGACGKIKLPSGPQLHYCYRDFQRSMLPDNITYFLHGLNGKAGDMLPFLSGSSLFYNAIADHRSPVFVSLSFGPNDIIPFEKNNGRHSVEDILNFAIPWIEREVLKYRYSPGESPNRHLVGISLGAFNALNIVANNPEYFKSLTALCPALFNFDPFDAESVSNYLARNRQVVDTNLVLSSVKEIQEKIQSSENWTNRSPFTHIKNGKFNDIPMFVSIGTEDEYGFTEGADIFSSQLKDQNSHFFYKRTQGRHCSFELGSLKTFFKNYADLPRKR